MARYCIILDAKTTASGYLCTRAFWLVAPTNRQVPLAGATSRVPDATQAEIALLRSGAIVEEIDESGQFPAGTTMAEFDSANEAEWRKRKAALDATAPPADVIGRYHDGTRWLARGTTS